VTIEHISAFKPGLTLENNGYYTMSQIKEEGVNYPWFVPTVLPSESGAIFRVNVRETQPSPITISSFMIGTNVAEDKHSLGNLSLLTFQEPQNPTDPIETPLTIGSAQYLILVVDDKSAVNLYHQVKIVINNTENSFVYRIPQDTSADIYYFIDTNWYGQGNQSTEKIPVDCTLIDSTNNSVVIFGDDEDYGDDNTPNNQISTSFVNLRKDLYTFDFGMQP